MDSFAYVTGLQYENRDLRNRIREYESGERYIRLQEQHRQEVTGLYRRIHRLEQELADANARIVTNRNLWMQANEDVVRVAEKEIARKEAELKAAREKMYEAQRQRDAALDRERELKRQLYQVQGELENEKEKKRALAARIHKDYTNSSKPSSQNPNHKIIPNGREKTGRKPGGQKGHVHHPRPEYEPTDTVDIPTPDEYRNRDLYVPTGRVITKKLVGISVGLEVTEYRAKEYREKATGRRVHAAFPGGLKDECTYDDTVKAFAYTLTHQAFVSVGRTKQFLSEITGGQLNLSEGMICGLAKEFSEKSCRDREEIYTKLQVSPYLHGDFTFVRNSGRLGTILVCASPEYALYMNRPAKGDAGIRDTPLDGFPGTVTCDHESAIAKCGSRHQECLIHISRYAKGSMENETDRNWNKEMYSLIQEMLRERKKAVSANAGFDPEKVKEFKKRYKQITEQGKKEYEDSPPSPYYRDGYNLWKRMYEHPEDYLLFLDDIRVDPDNNLCERLARPCKRKSAQAMTFRSREGISYFCDGMTMFQKFRQEGTHAYDGVREIFARPSQP